MFGTRTRKDPRPPSSPFDVLIGEDGRVTVDGEPLAVPEGEPVHVAVLDVMHRHARESERPVEAAILDRQQGEATVVEVAPDGSSRVVLHERFEEPPREDGPDETPDGTGVAPPPADARVPDQLAELVRLVGESLDSGAPERAAALAFRLREHTVRAFGPGHPHTLEAHALEAYVAHRSANHRLATDICLELARVRHGQGDPRAHEELTRAVAAWLRNDDVPSAVEQGRALLAALLTLRPERPHQAAPDAAVPHLVNRRMQALTASPVPGAA
ncbi:hypothetical protein [Streptomyces sp. B93]|uniref:hypothetical protein n=1 Tax=Streptomyces sp. B93 TaxID=2824875 RepID=UPI001B38D328|nr:hypothetical protein [Streptomyces sp. B93]MBQ1093499.1 hypothetical protein [Streptomyces sp. B93]